MDPIVADEVIPTKVHIQNEQSNTKKLPDILREMVKDEGSYTRNNNRSASSRVIKTESQDFNRKLYNKVYGDQVNPSVEDNYLKVPNASDNTANYVSKYASNNTNRTSTRRV